MRIYSLIFCALASFSALYASESSHIHRWILGGDLQVHFESDTSFQIDDNAIAQLSAHLPGFSTANSTDSGTTLKLCHRYAATATLVQNEAITSIAAPWSQQLPPDFIHLVYGIARREWLQQGIFPVHAACIGNEQEGYTLLVGAPGAGKTSLVLTVALRAGYKVYSGDKTLLRFDKSGQLEAVAGTSTLTVRQEDIGRWQELPKVHVQPVGDRLSFQLLPEYYTETGAVPIKRIVLVGLNDGVELVSQLTVMSALHTLYPFFLDKQREDILIGTTPLLFDGAIAAAMRSQLAQALKVALEDIPTYKVLGSLKHVSSFIAAAAKLPAETQPVAPKKILCGICGIGNGHCSRQLPVIRHLLSAGHRLWLFTYGEGLTFFQKAFAGHPQLTVIPVANPYFVGNLRGLDFEQTGLCGKNKVDFNAINTAAKHRLNTECGRPDLVISDYEMVAAQYAYIKDAPLVTFDQQSKYLSGDFAPFLNGTAFADEVERLRLFFPKAEKRLAVSFFRVSKKPQQRGQLEVEIFAPLLRSEVLQAKDYPLSADPSILVYITAQQLGEQPIDSWLEALASALPLHYTAHIFLPRRLTLPPDKAQLFFYHHGDERFDALLFAAHGLVTTAGHTLLSEAMYLEKPVYALPLPLYEQQLNADVIARGPFGVRADTCTPEQLQLFFTQLAHYAQNIRDDRELLLKEPSHALILERIDSVLYSTIYQPSD